MTPSIFTRIINRDIKAHILYEDEVCIAILDIFPLSPGHTLIISKEPCDEWGDLPFDTLAHLLLIAKKVSHSLKVLFPECRVILSIEGFEVPHTHIHLVPSKVPSTQLARPTEMMDSDSLERMATDIITSFSYVSA